jgi:hypothetical protein
MNFLSDTKGSQGNLAQQVEILIPFRLAGVHNVGTRRGEGGNAPRSSNQEGAGEKPGQPT